MSIILLNLYHCQLMLTVCLSSFDLSRSTALTRAPFVGTQDQLLLLAMRMLLMGHGLVDLFLTSAPRMAGPRANFLQLLPLATLPFLMFRT